MPPPTYVGGARAYFPTESPFESNFLGIPLQVSSTPYISQDSQVMACATAALWMSSTVLARNTGTTEFQTADITSMALSIRRPYGPSLGERGLTITQMEHALLEMGYDPKIWERPDAENLLRYAYLYTESGIPPVILLDIPQVGGHAVTVVGHLFDTSVPRNKPLVPGIFVSTDFIPGLIIHDDQRGPYLRMDVDSTTPKERRERPYNSKVTVHTPAGTMTGFCAALIVPVPQRAMMPANNAIASAASWVSTLQSIGAITSGDMVIRGFLVRSNRYKHAAWQLPRLHTQVATVYRGLPMPRYVWVVEFTHKDKWVGSSPSNLEIEGEFIFDGTFIANPRPHFLAAHLPGAVGVSRRTEQGMRSNAIHIAHDTPYEPLGMPIRL